MVIDLELNEAISRRVQELLDERKWAQYELHVRSGVPKSTISNIVNCTYPSMKMRIIHELCQGFGIEIPEFFQSPLFRETNLEP